MRDTETLEIENLRITHLSIFSDKKDFPPAPVGGDKIEIALYHGVVTGADFGGFMAKSGDMKCSDFDGYDMVLLGDIHSVQTLQTYDTEEIEIDEAELPKYLKDGWNV